MSSSYVSLLNHSDFSLKKGFSKPVRLVERAVQLGMGSLAITDSGSLSGAVKFIQACDTVCECGHEKKKHGDKCCYGSHKACKCTGFAKKSIKPILGTEFNLCSLDATDHSIENEALADFTLLAKNHKGWKQLIKVSSESNRAEFYDKAQKKARLNLDRFAEFSDGNFVGISGYIGSEIANALFAKEDLRSLFYIKDKMKVRELSNKSKVNDAIALAEKYQSILGKGNFFLGAQLFDKKDLPATEFISDAMRYISQKTGIPVVALGDSYYPAPEDYEDHQIIVCSGENSTFQTINRKLQTSKDASLRAFFNSRQYYLQDPTHMLSLHTESEIANSLLIAEMCEQYKVLSKPMIPDFFGPNGEDPETYLRKLCIEGWKQKIAGIIPKDQHQIYGDRIKHELSVIGPAGLSSYFLIVQDYIAYARSHNQLLSPSRGSGGGSLLSYLLDISRIDPIIYHLIFERFYNEGRNTEDYVSLPDIDSDFTRAFRKKVIKYIETKHKPEHVGHMATFGRIQGRSSASEVFRMKYASQLSFDEQKTITNFIPDEAEIADELQEMREAGEEPSIIMWALEHRQKQLKQYCWVDDEGELQGEFAPAIAQAMRIEGTKKSQGKHASGIVISKFPLAETIPMIHDNSKESQGSMLTGFDMHDTDAMGVPKFDILGLKTLDVLMGVQQLTETGEFCD